MELVPAILLLFAMCGVLLLVGGKRRDGSNGAGLWTGARMFISLLPLLVLAFTLAGLLQVVVSPEFIRSWLGEETGWQGVVLAVGCGGIILGGPYAVFPIIAEVYRSGAGLGAAVAMISGWALLGVAQLIMGVTFIGVRFTFIRTLIVLVFPFLAGAMVHFWVSMW